jgi:hypothetical protein
MASQCVDCGQHGLLQKRVPGNDVRSDYPTDGKGSASAVLERAISEDASGL